MLRTARIQEKAPTPRGDGPDKINKFKWASVGREGDLQKIPKADLCVDGSYQRDGINSRVVELAKDWWWMACGVLTVVKRTDGRLVIIDGQHRWLAACNRSDIDKMPCIVFDELEGGVAQEAAAFVKANTNRKTVKSADMFKARGVAGDENVRLVQGLCDSIGRQIGGTSSSSKSVNCVGALMWCAKNNEAALRRVWPIIAEVCEGRIIPDVLVKGMHYLESSIEGDASLAGEPWVSRIRKVGSESLVRAAGSFAEAIGKRNAKSWAHGMAVLLNKGLRSKKLPDGSS
jgi:hypothetical protein